MARQIGDVAARLAERWNARNGTAWTYSRGTDQATITFYKSDLPPIAFDNGGGLIVEVIPTSFRGLYSSLTDFGKPQANDRISNGDLTFKVIPIEDKCYYTIGGMVHIHAAQVAG